MASVEINLAKVRDRESFHAEFAEVMGFPDFYGQNMNAWEDCMSDLSTPDRVGMTGVQVVEGEDLVLALHGSVEFRERLPEIFAELFGSTAHVNRRKEAIPNASRLLLLPL